MEMIVGEAGWKNEAFGDGTQGKSLILFYTRQIKHNFESARQKRPIFIDKVFIKKLIPGDNRLVIDRPMRESDMEEFPIEWARYEQKKANVVHGTPLEAWNIITDIQKAEFKALNIFTIDQFAKLPDSAGSNIMGFHDLREKAKAFLSASNDSALMDKLRAEADEKIAAQAKIIEQMQAQMATLMAGGSKPRKKHAMSAEQKQAAAERMRKYHAERAAAKAATEPVAA